MNAGRKKRIRCNIVQPRKSVQKLIHFEVNPIMYFTQQPVPPPRRKKVAQ